MAVARRIAAESGLVVLIDRADLVHEVAQEIRDCGSEALSVTADLERYDETLSAMASAQSWRGRIDVLINNVGGTIWARPFEHYGPDEIQQEIQRSLFPTLWSCRAVLPYLIEQQAGVIVNVSSIATRGINRVPYAAAKGGIGAITSALAMETARHGIRVVATAPGGTEAPERRVKRGPSPNGEQERAWFQEIVDQTVDSSLMKRYGTLDEQTAPIVFLASDEASYLTGTVVAVAGGDQG
jgi:dihydroxycyclohexadiene carboxylate dehydrogenase